MSDFKLHPVLDETLGLITLTEGEAPLMFFAEKLDH